MAKTIEDIRKRTLKHRLKLEAVAHELWLDESRLSEIAEAENDAEARAFAAALGCACVDHLRPVIEVLRKAAEPKRRPEPESEDDEAPLPGAFARC